MREITVNKNDGDKRLDKFLLRLMPDLSKNLLYKSLRKNCVKVNGKHIKDGAFKISEGDILTLYFEDSLFEKPSYHADFMKISPKLNIVYEDENLLLVNKPQGVLVHEDDRQNPENLLSHIKSYLYKKGEYLPEKENTFAPALANRIDRGTGGIVIAAKNAEALRILNEKIKNREIKKYYLCLAEGIFEEKSGEISGYVLRDEKNRKTAFFDAPLTNAKKTETTYRVLEEFPGYSLLEVELKTGRTHQIRASLSHIGHPLLGDRKYASADAVRRFGYSYPALFAYKLKFEFKEDAGILEYLNGKVFEIKDVKFD
ncbi:MAG: RluA family pseudouridine synthase [Clostridia bacterium]|nr:RluA family pseudouridine synthase [Clostridia bacterium]